MNWTVMMGLSTAIWHVALSFSYWDEVGYSDDYHTTTAHFNSRIERISPGTHGISTIRCRQSKVRTSLNGLVWMKRTIRAWLASKVRLAVSTAAGPQISLSHCVKRESSRIFLALNMFTQQISVSSTDMADSTEVSDGQTRPQDHSCYLKGFLWLQYSLPSGNGWHSFWKWPFIVDFPIKNGDFPLLC